MSQIYSLEAKETLVDRSWVLSKLSTSKMLHFKVNEKLNFRATICTFFSGLVFQHHLISTPHQPGCLAWPLMSGETAPLQRWACGSDPWWEEPGSQEGNVCWGGNNGALPRHPPKPNLVLPEQQQRNVFAWKGACASKLKDCHSGNVCFSQASTLLAKIGCSVTQCLWKCLRTQV